MLEQDQIASGTPTATYYPAADGSGTAVWTAMPATGSGQWKDPVRVATTTNGTLSTAYENGDTVDGVTLATGDRILLKNQSTASQNGIYTVNASGSPTRAADANTGSEMVAAMVYVREGTQNGGSAFVCTNTGTITIDSTGLTFKPTTSPFSEMAGRNKWSMRSGVDTITDETDDAQVYMSGGYVEIIGGADGWVKLAPNNYGSGGGADAKVVIEGGHGLVLMSLSADPSGANSENGQIYYNSTTHKFRGYANGSWVDLH